MVCAVCACMSARVTRVAPLIVSLHQPDRYRIHTTRPRAARSRVPITDTPCLIYSILQTVRPDSWTRVPRPHTSNPSPCRPSPTSNPSPCRPSPRSTSSGCPVLLLKTTYTEEYLDRCGIIWGSHRALWLCSGDWGARGTNSKSNWWGPGG